jgi:hypothetical protein
MADLIVIFDADKQMAAIVDADTRTGFGPAMIGSDAAQQLEAFLATVPYDLTSVPSTTVRDWFEQFSEAFHPPAATAAVAADTGVVVAAGSAGVDADAAAAAAEAVNATSTPAPAPADTDMAAHQGAEDQVAQAVRQDPTPATVAAAQPVVQPGPCPLCNGTGNIPGTAAGELVTCNMCHGTGTVTPQPAS